MDKKELTHLDESGRANMVDISQKLPTIAHSNRKRRNCIIP